MRRPVLILALLAPGLASAGHGQDFLLVGTPGGPAVGEAWLSASMAGFGRGASPRATFGPGIGGGLSPRITWGVHAHLQDDRAGGWASTGTSIGAQYTFTEGAGPQAAVAMQYTAAREAPGSMAATLALQAGDAQDEWAADLVVDHGGGATGYGAIVGWRHALRDGLALSVEAGGSLQRADGAELAIGLHVDPSPGWAFKFGLGAARQDDRVVPVTRAVLLLRLRNAR